MGGFVPEFFELVGGEFHVVVIVAEGIEFVGLFVVLSAEAGGGEIRGTGDDVAGLVLVETLGEEDVDFCVEAFGGMGADFYC